MDMQSAEEQSTDTCDSTLSPASRADADTPVLTEDISRNSRISGNIQDGRPASALKQSQENSDREPDTSSVLPANEARTFTIQQQDADRRLDRILPGYIPGAALGAIQKLLRKKEIRLNGKPAKAETHVQAGDTLRIFAPVEFFTRVKKPDPFLSKFRVRIRVAYEDQNILVIDKQPGLRVHADSDEKIDTLVHHVQAYLYQKGEYDPETDYAPAPCNRIDRFTGGLVLFARNKKALVEMDNAIRNHKLDKEYLLAIRGTITPRSGKMCGHMVHEESHMKVLDYPTPNSQKAELTYATMLVSNGMSLLACKLLTGRTHQIRAQFAHAGHALIGDTQYGIFREDESMGLHYQALWSWRVTFHGLANELSYLNEQTITSSFIPFLHDLFPDASTDILSEAPTYSDRPVMSAIGSRSRKIGRDANSSAQRGKVPPRPGIPTQSGYTVHPSVYTGSSDPNLLITSGSLHPQKARTPAVPDVSSQDHSQEHSQEHSQVSSQVPSQAPHKRGEKRTTPAKNRRASSTKRTTAPNRSVGIDRSAYQTSRGPGPL